MPTYQFHTYSPGALPYDPATGTFTLDPAFDPATGRTLLVVNDDDPFLDGDLGADEIGEDINQTGEAFAPDGTTIASGQIYAEAFAVIQSPDGTLIYIDRIEIEGVHVGYSTSQPLGPGVSYSFIRQEDIDDAPGGDPLADNRLTYADYEAQTVTCLLSGTLLMTADGMMPVDWITVGDRVATLDHGLQPVRWRGHRDFRHAPEMPPPILIAPGTFGVNRPDAPLRVSPLHRLLLCGPACQLWFGTEEVLVAARHLLHFPGITEVAARPSAAYHHLLFDAHEILICDGMPAESLFLGAQAAGHAPAPPQQLARTLGPGHATTARICLTAREARVLSQRDFAASTADITIGAVA